MALALRFGAVGDGHLGTLYQGDCDHVRRLITYLLIPLNIIGTVSIGSSNYVMQCLMAPNRKEVDKAHLNGLYVNIGLSSAHNIPWLSGWKAWTWWTLGFSTIPIHLLLNSAVFSTLHANNYGAMIVSSGFMQDSSWDYCSHPANIDTESATFVCSLYKSVKSNSTIFDVLSPEACIQRYGSAVRGAASNVVLVTNNTSEVWASVDSDRPGLTFEASFGHVYVSQRYIVKNEVEIAEQSANRSLFLEADSPLWNITSLRGVFAAFDYRLWTLLQEIHYDLMRPEVRLGEQWNPSSWLCDPRFTLGGGDCSAQTALENAGRWEITPKAFVIDHCLSTTSEQQCTVQYSFYIILTLVICDCIKVSAIGYTLRSALKIPNNPEDDPLTTIGDAIASFLSTSDPTSRGRCLIDAKFVRSLPTQHTGPGYLWEANSLEQRRILSPKWFGETPLEWKTNKNRWYNVPSKSRWFIFTTLYIGILAASLAIFTFAIQDIDSPGFNTVSRIWQQGLEMNPKAIFAASMNTGASGSGSGITLLINLPQLLFSLLYFMYNSLFTTYMINREWGLMSSQRRSLRVSTPRQGQRWTYWLSLPWRYSIPLIAVSSTLHWLLSRSLFLVRIHAYGRDGKRETDRDISACGFSPLAILLVLVILVVMLVVLMIYGVRKVAPGIPSVGTCSWAISAACHPLTGGEGQDETVLPLKWGVVLPAMKDQPGHCCVTSLGVDGPVEGQTYK